LPFRKEVLPKLINTRGGYCVGAGDDSHRFRLWHRYEPDELSEVLGGGNEVELIARAVRSAQSQAVEAQDPLEMSRSSRGGSSQLAGPAVTPPVTARALWKIAREGGDLFAAASRCAGHSLRWPKR
jgi:hypothetical protein